jgi:hypothetical protein
MQRDRERSVGGSPDPCEGWRGGLDGFVGFAASATPPRNDSRRVMTQACPADRKRASPPRGDFDLHLSKNAAAERGHRPPTPAGTIRESQPEHKQNIFLDCFRDFGIMAAHLDRCPPCARSLMAAGRFAFWGLMHR